MNVHYSTSCTYYVIRHLCMTIFFLTRIVASKDLEDLEYFQPYNYNDIRCYLNTRADDSGLRVAEEDESYPEKSIFFLVTTCRGGIDSRQSCAIEAAARANPDWQINVLFTGPVAKAFTKGDALLDLEDFPNVKARRIYVNKFVKGTPVEKIFDFGKGFIRMSQWPTDHTADILKILTLNKYGGVYLDLDVYAVKSFSSLPKNFVGSELGKYIGSAVIGASKYGIGRNFTETILKELETDFQPYLWQYNGPSLLRRVLEKMCYPPYVNQMSARSCNGFEVFADKYIYPIDYFHWWVYFEPWEFNYSEAYTHHLWYMISFNETITQDSLFGQIAKKHCPTVLDMYGDKFGRMRFEHMLSY